MLNLPVWVEKETAMQIEDKNVLNCLNDSVLVATGRHKLAPAILFQLKCMNLVENLSKAKNVINYYFYYLFQYIRLKESIAFSNLVAFDCWKKRSGQNDVF